MERGKQEQVLIRPYYACAVAFTRRFEPFQPKTPLSIFFKIGVTEPESRSL